MADPDIEIQRPAGHANEIIHTGTDDVGLHPYGVPVSLVYTVANVGIEIDSFTFSDVDEGQAIDEIMTAQGGIGAQTWTLDSGSLPPGITLETDGQVHGTTTTAGTYNFTLQVDDADGHSDTEDFEIVVNPGVLPPDPADFTSYYGAQDLALTVLAIDKYNDQGPAGNDVTYVAFGNKNTLDTIVRPLDGFDTILMAGSGNDNWYDSDSNAIASIAEETGTFYFIFYCTSVAGINTLWAMNTPGNGKISLFDSAGTPKARVKLGAGGSAITVDSTALTLNQWNFLTVRYHTVAGNTELRVQLNNDTEQQGTATGISLSGKLGQPCQWLADGGTEILRGSSSDFCTRNTYTDDAGVSSDKASFKVKFPSLPI